MSAVVPHVDMSGNRQAQCPSCGALFNTDSLFDRHRTGSYAAAGKPSTRRCSTAEEMTARGWVINRHGFWGGKPPSPAERERLAARRATSA